MNQAQTHVETGPAATFPANQCYHIVMRESLNLSSLAACAITIALCAGCASVSLPPAKGYAVQVGNAEYYARSVKIHGQWIEMETDNGPVWANSVVSIKPQTAKASTSAAPAVRGPAYGREQELRQQLAQSIPMKEYGYTIRELRFSPDYKKALVMFTHADTRARPDWEFVLMADDFGRYRGTSGQPFYTPGTANTPPIYLTVVLPPE